MKEHAFLVPTSSGNLGVIIAEPEGPAKAAAVLLHGGGTSGRPGNNRVFARIGRALAEQGVLVARTDYPGQGASIGVVDLGARKSDTPGDEEAIRDLVAWVRGRTPGLNLLMIGSCYGSRIASRIAARDASVSGLMLLTPAIQSLARARPPRRRRLVRRVRAIARRLRRYRPSPTGRAALPDRSSQAPRLDRDVAAAVAAAAARMPCLLLAGDRDVAARLVPAIEHHVRSAAARLDVEIIPDTVLHAYPSADAQRIAVDHASEWTRTLVDSWTKAPEREPKPAG